VTKSGHFWRKKAFFEKICRLIQYLKSQKTGVFNTTVCILSKSGVDINFWPKMIIMLLKWSICVRKWHFLVQLKVQILGHFWQKRGVCQKW
jgi:hypothetical protein